MSQENSFRWTDAFLLGYGPMDDTHREFVDIVGALLTCEDSALAGHMQAFIAHAESHFGAEDAWMEKSDFPARGCHVDEHAAVLSSAREVLPLVEGGNFEIGRRFAAELERWFPGHADYLDSALAQWMVKRSHGGVPIVLRRSLAPNAA